MEIRQRNRATVKSKETRGKKLLYYLALLSPRQWQDFEVWLSQHAKPQGPDWKQSLNLLKTVIQEKRPLKLSDLEPLLLSQTEVKTSREKYIGVRLSQLLKMLHQYLLSDTYANSGELKALLTLKSHIQIRDEKYLQKVYDKVLRAFSPAESTLQIRNKLEAEMMMNKHLAGSSSKPGVSHLAEVEDALDSYYSLQKLKYGAARLVETMIGGPPRPIRLIEAILTEVKTHYEQYPVLVQTYYHCFEMLNLLEHDPAASEQHFELYLELYQQPAIQALPEARDLLTYGQNYAVLKIRAGKDGYKAHLAALYSSALVNRIYEDNQFLSPLFLKNLVELFCKMQMRQFAKESLNGFISSIQPERRLAIEVYNQAVIRFFEKDYHSVIRACYQVLGSFQELAYELGARTYLCRSLWQTAQYESLLDALHAFTQYVFRKKQELGELAGLYRFFIGFLSRMAKASQENPEKQAALFTRIHKDFMKKNEANQFGWLRKQISERVAGSEFVERNDYSAAI